jgi:hypothetical protein
MATRVATPHRNIYDFLLGTFLPAFLASESPMAIACFLLVTFLPLRPLFSLPFFIARISVSTFFPADGEYFLREDFLEAPFFDLFADDFFVAISGLLVVWMTGCFVDVVLIACNQRARVSMLTQRGSCLA